MYGQVALVVCQSCCISHESDTDARSSLIQVNCDTDRPGQAKGGAKAKSESGHPVTLAALSTCCWRPSYAVSLNWLSMSQQVSGSSLNRPDV